MRALILAAAVAGFADDFLPSEMARRQIPGAVFVFVSGGKVEMARGFGAAQLEPYVAVDPDRTVFRLASVSKTITATAALQLVERGLIDRHRDVGAYLKSFQLQPQHGPITLHHLLTHTAGFEERLTGAAARTAREVEPSSSYLARSMPPTFIAPGQVLSYSNHGYALVGQLVEDVSGRPFAEYVRQEVFEALGMRRSGSLTDPLPENLAVAYDYADARHHPVLPDYLQVASAGAFYTTGTDMARFLIAHLRGGAFEDRRILRPETVAMMHSQQFTPVAGTSGFAYGLWEDARDGHRALLHNGGGKGFRALLYLLPEQDAGFFLAYNLADRHEEGELLEAFITAFRRRFLPAAPPPAPTADHVASAGELTGDYVYVRRARSSVEKMIAILNQVRITTDENAQLILSSRSIGRTALTPIGPRLFRRADGHGTVAFDSTDSVHIAAITDSGFPAMYERIPLHATLRFQVAWVLGMLLVLLYALVRRPLLLSRVTSLLCLLFLVGFPFAFLGSIEGGVPEFLYGIPIAARLLLFIPPIALVLAIAVWRRSKDPVVVLGVLAVALFAWYWRLLPALNS